jgi:mannose-6-phosphate isomerase
MVFEITNTPLDYAWGSRTLLAEFRGTSATGVREAELWFGDHPSSPAQRVVDGRSVRDWQRESGHPAFPFLVKILAVDGPLSLQVHPTKRQARRGFAREDRARIPLGSPLRNFRDRNHKPEAILALTEFRAFVGFSPREVHEPILARLETLAVAGVEALTQTPRDVAWPLDSQRGVAHLAELSASLGRGIPGLTDDTEADRAIGRAIELARFFPDDPSAALTLLLNYCVVQPGEVLFVPAGTIHSYLSGLGLEAMATSDNVLRAGLTSKHIDVAALLDSLSTEPTVDAKLSPQVVDGVSTFNAPVTDFFLRVLEVEGSRAYPITGPAIVVATEGTVTLVGDSSLTLARGAAAIVERGETISSVAGDGMLVVVSKGVRRRWFGS